MTDLADIDSQMNGAQHDLREVATKDEQVQRLVDKHAADGADHREAPGDGAQLHINSLNEKRKAMAQSASAINAAAKARLDDAEAAARLAQIQIDQSMVRAPIDGTMYEFNLKPGAYLNAGDKIGLIGKLDRVRVIVFVDEPDLGHVKIGLPVSITWDAIAGREWTGLVDKMPTEIKERGTRKGGRGACVIDKIRIAICCRG